MSQNWPQMFVRVNEKGDIVASRAFSDQAEVDRLRHDGWISKDEARRGVRPADPKDLKIAKLTALSKSQALTIDSQRDIISALEAALAEAMRFPSAAESDEPAPQNKGKRAKAQDASEGVEG